MASKTLVGGTAYSIKGGKTLVGGTAYSVRKGKTLIGGTGYHIRIASGSTSRVLGTYTLVSGSFAGNGGTYFAGIVGQGDNTSTQSTNNYYTNNSGDIAVFTYSMSVSLPSGAQVTNAYVKVNGHAESLTNSDEYMTVQLKSGSTTFSNKVNFKDYSTSNQTITVNATTLPTVSQLQNMVLECTVGRYGGALNGATLYVQYNY